MNSDPWGHGQPAGGGSDPAGGWQPATYPRSTATGAQGAGSFGLGAGSFGPAAPLPTPAAPGKPPVVWLGLSAVAAVLGGFVAWFLGLALIPALFGWLLAGPVAVGLLARFIWRDTVRRARPTRIDYGWTTSAYYGCLVLAIAATALAAYEIAVWFGRSGGPLL